MTTPQAPQDQTPEPALPVRRLTLYKHGVGVVEREGAFSGEALRLVFRAAEVNDALKSLLVLDRRGGQVLGIDYQTPVDQAARLAEGPLDLSPDHTLLDLLRALRGAHVRLVAGSGTRVQEVSGRLLGTEVAEGDPARRALVPVWDEDAGAVRTLRLGALREVALTEDRPAQDVRHFLDTSRSEESRRTVTVRLSPGEHDLAVSYLVPSPTWRVSYRLVAESGPGAGEGAAEGEGPSQGQEQGARRGALLLQGWGLFDNRLEEDLAGVQVTLVAGQPISFVYDLATSRIPARRVVQDEVRVAEAPVEVERPLLARRGPRGVQGVPTLHAGASARNVLTSAMPSMQFDAAESAEPPALATIDEMERQEVGAAGSELGELFQYEVVAPVTVGRGASALVPILGTRLPYRRPLLFNQRKLPLHPVVTLRFQNDTGLVLERGPVTVVEDGDYRGEAIVPFTRPGREVALAFAVELGITVRQTPRVRLEQAGLRIEKALLWSKQARLQETEYLLASELGTDEVVTVEHPILPGYDLVQTPPPDERTADWYRWRVPCPPGVGTTFVVTQRTIEWQQQLLLDVSYESLRTFLERRWLDPPTMDRIRALLRERQAIARGVQEIATLQAERERIFQRQEQLRQNLGVLSTSGQEAALRQQVFLQLQASEGRLSAIDERAEALEAENRRRQEALDAALEELAVEEQGDAPADGAPSGSPSGGR